MRQVIESLSDTSPDEEDGLSPRSVAFVTKLLAAFEQDTQGEAAPAPPPQTPCLADPTAGPALAEPLTRREQEVLRLLVAGASNQEIASELVISLWTVKKHVSNLLGKLGLASRAQAIARARDWSALD
jgi:LuxR family maltose regulon positive regulatory protein